ncbi:MAG: hypothetical protein GY810_19245 [Aureispira sp.]|nr:hypothetical protein [Aureispira sp.]
MKKLLLVLTLIISSLGISQQAKAQYKMALGARLGSDLGFTIKYAIAEPHIIEGIVATRLWYNNGFGLKLTALYEYHGNIANIDGFRWFAGGGAHIGFWNGHSNHKYYYEDRTYLTLGIDGIVGLEYTFKFPLNLSLDFKPSFNFGGGRKGYGSYNEVALSIRYAIQ